jgi:sugar lactone lactonase YvrE
MDAQENIYGVDYQQHKQCQIVKISPDGRVTSLAGGDWGYADGKGPQAKFRDLHGSAFAWAADGALLITDNGTFVRKVTPEGMVSTLAGGEEAGFMDGSATEARFNGAMGIAVESSGSVYVADSRNRRIRKVSPDGDVSTYAGTGQGREANGLRQKATFENPAGVAVGRDGTVYVLDYVRSDPHVRKITPEGIVTTIAEVD